MISRILTTVALCTLATHALAQGGAPTSFDRYIQLPGNGAEAIRFGKNVDLQSNTSNAGATFGVNKGTGILSLFRRDIYAGKGEIFYIQSEGIGSAGASFAPHKIRFIQTSNITGKEAGEVRIATMSNGVLQDRVSITENGGTILTAFIALPPPTTKTADHTVAESDYSLIFDGAKTITVTLPLARAYPGRIIVMKTISVHGVVSASSDVVPQVGGSAGVAILSGVAGRWAQLQSDGAHWQIMMSN